MSKENEFLKDVVFKRMQKTETPTCFIQPIITLGYFYFYIPLVSTKEKRETFVGILSEIVVDLLQATVAGLLSLCGW